ncbi:MAG TPA: hypothetical protein VGH87_02545, partial [Polyangiaceae bacterium]
MPASKHPSVAPPRPSVAPTSQLPPRSRDATAKPATPPARGAITLKTTIVLVAVCDFALAIRPTVSLALTTALTLAIAPWLVTVLRTRGRGLLFHAANALLVLAFTTAKWLVLFDAVRVGSAAFV